MNLNGSLEKLTQFFFFWFTQFEVPHGIAEFDYNGSNTGELSFQVTSKSINSHQAHSVVISGYCWFICHSASEFQLLEILPFLSFFSLQKNEVLVLLEELDSRTFECQAGNTKGTVQKSHMKIITPLTDLSSNFPQVINIGINSVFKNSCFSKCITPETLIELFKRMV